MARKGWNALSSGYRSRLEKAGISRSDYDSGQSIQSARGHSKTPERPSQANPIKHATYVAERNRLVDRIIRKKQDWFGTSPKWNPIRASQPFKDNPPPITMLRYWVTLSRDEWVAAIRDDDNTYIRYLGYQ